MAARISIGLPVFNGAETLQTALTSLLSQSFSDFDLTISDNGSTDATAKIAQSAAASDSRVKYVRHAENIGAVANFEYVFQHTTGELFMWAAADDIRHPSWLEKAVETLSRRPDAVLAASDIAMCHDINAYGRPDCHVSYHRLTAGIDDKRPHIRYRTIVREGGWSATYGLIRREHLAKTRLLADMHHLPSLGIAADYRLMELCLLGPFAYIEEPLLVNQVRERTQADLTTYLLPSAHKQQIAARSSLWWQFRDLLHLGARYGLPPGDRIALQLEYLKCLKNPGTLHTHMVNRNIEATLSTQSCRTRFALSVERLLFLRSKKLDLLLENRKLSFDLRQCQNDLVDRTRRLEKHIADYGPEI